MIERVSLMHGAGRRPWRRLLTLLCLAVLVPVVASASHHLPNEADPEFADSAFEVHTHGRIFYSIQDIDFMLEYVGRFEDPEREFRYQGLTFGGYYRLLRNLKLGAFYRLQSNVRHDDDWIEEGTAWLWADATGRREHVGMIDATPRFLLDFLPGRDWVFSVKNRYEYNFTTSEQTLLVRPGLTWFWIRNREPVLNVSAQHATYFSLNFGSVPWYRHGPYLSALYHLSRNIKLSLAASRQWIYWSESDVFLDDFPTSTYEDNIYSPWLMDLGVIVQLR